MVVRGGRMDLENIIRDVPDFPKKGIIFKDITTLLQDGEAFRLAMNSMLKKYLDAKIDKVVGIEARGFIFGGVLAYKLGCGFVPARKPGKLPYRTIREEYTLEYGSNSLEIHDDSIRPGAGPDRRRPAGHGRHGAGRGQAGGKTGRGSGRHRISDRARLFARPGQTAQYPSTA